LCAVDFDNDGYYEIYIPKFDAGTGLITMRAFLGSGLAAPLDSEVLPAPNGGQWKQISDAAVAGNHYGNDLRVVVAGLASNAAIADQEQWTLALGVLTASGAAMADPVPGFAIDVTTPAGDLDTVWSFLPPPLAWNFASTGSADPEIMVAMHWQELIAGALDRRGSTFSFFRPESTDSPKYCRYSWAPGGSQVDSPGFVSTGLLSLDNECWGRTLCLDRTVFMQAAIRYTGPATVWSSRRADSRNSGAYPLSDYDPTPAGQVPITAAQLTTWPNPSAGICRIAWSSALSGRAVLAIYDLRGRLINSYTVDENSGNNLVWNGCDKNNQPVATGSYLFVLTHQGGKISGKVLLTH